jgi:hypothetical protein
MVWNSRNTELAKYTGQTREVTVTLDVYHLYKTVRSPLSPKLKIYFPEKYCSKSSLVWTYDYFHAISDQVAQGYSIEKCN